MTVIKICNEPDYKEIEQELGIKIECIARRRDGIYVQVDGELSDKKFNDTKKVLEKHFPNKKIEKQSKKIKPQDLGKPNVNKKHVYKNLPIEQKIKNKKFALKHYEQALSYEINNPGRTPKDRQKVQRSIRQINRLKEKESKELEELVAEKNRLSPKPPKHQDRSKT